MTIPEDLPQDMRRWAGMGESVMLPADVVTQWADAIETLAEDNQALRRATNLHRVTGPLLQAVTSTEPERCMSCDQPAEEFELTCPEHSTGPTVTLGDKIRAQREHAIPGSQADQAMERLAADADDRDRDTARREATWKRLYTSMKRQRNTYRQALAAERTARD